MQQQGPSLSVPQIQKDLPPSVSAIKHLLEETQREIDRLKELHLVQPPTREKISSEITSKPNVSTNRRVYIPNLAGRQLTPDERTDWGRKRKQGLQDNAVKFEKYIQSGLFENDQASSGVDMKVTPGNLLLVRVDNNSFLEGFSYDTFTSMMANPKLTSTFHDRLGIMSIAKSLLQKIISSDRLFESSNSFTSKADTKPRQRRTYETSIAAERCRFEADLSPTARGRHGIGFGELFDQEALRHKGLA